MPYFTWKLEFVSNILSMIVGLFMSYDIFFIFALIFIVISYITSLTCIFVYFLEYLLLFLDDNVQWFPNYKRLASGCCLDFLGCCQFQLDIAYKKVLIKTCLICISCNTNIIFISNFLDHIAKGILIRKSMKIFH